MAVAVDHGYPRRYEMDSHMNENFYPPSDTNMGADEEEYPDDGYGYPKTNKKDGYYAPHGFGTYEKPTMNSYNHGFPSDGSDSPYKMHAPHGNAEEGYIGLGTDVGAKATTGDGAWVHSTADTSPFAPRNTKTRYLVPVATTGTAGYGGGLDKHFETQKTTKSHQNRSNFNQNSCFQRSVGRPRLHNRRSVPESYHVL
mgnify:CR=1 FL=1